MCETCKASYESYEALYEQLKASRDAAEEAQKAMKDIQSNFENVKFDGVSLGEEELTSCIENFSIVLSELSTTIEDCLNKMSEIESSCPGPDHYKNEKK